MASFDHEELTVLEQHLRECEVCRVAYADYLLSLARESSREAGGARLLSWSPVDARRRRFLQAAGGEGLTFSPAALSASPDTAVDARLTRWRRAPSRRWRAAAAVALAGGLGGAGAFLSERAQPDLGGALALVERESAARRDARRQRTALASADGGAVAADLSVELERARAAAVSAGARIATLASSLDVASAELEALRSEAEQATRDREAWRASVREAEERLATLQTERDRLHEQRAADATFMELQEARIDRLSGEIRDRDATVARQQELLGADRDIRDLMGARSLHVIDVFDVDGRGKTRKAFGRAFYTEGKSLIFYAFDLTGREALRTSFQAWGHRASDERSAQSLGILYSDDKAQNRWVLKFDDPKVLDQIDAVFVTVEPPGGSSRPSGQKLLYAYLRNSPNHP